MQTAELFVAKKLKIFIRKLLSVRTDKGGLRQYGHFVILCGRLLWTAL